jgi:hypothetical protein
MSWEISTIDASGQMLRMTPFMVPTYPSAWPKSVVRVIDGRDIDAPVRIVPQSGQSVKDAKTALDLRISYHL